jgi:hypothetical protein
MNWVWLAIAIPAMIGGYLLGVALGRHWNGNNGRKRKAAATLVAVALTLFAFAFFNIVPLISNALALVGLAAAGALRASRRQPAPSA